MKKLTRKDFKTVENNGVFYLSFKGKNCEICIESGFGCVDIAVYDLRQNIIEPKVTLNTPGNSVLAFVKFYKELNNVVNNFYQKYELKGGEKN